MHDNTTPELNKIQWSPPDTIWNRMFFSLFFANLALNAGQSMSNSLLAKYADSMGAPSSQIGMLMSMFALTALIFRFVSGPAMDSFNRKFIIMMAMGFMTTAYIGFSLSANIRSLMIFRLVQGIGNAFANACFLTIVADVLPRDKLNTGMGYYSVAQVVIQAIGPSIGLQLAAWFGYSRTYTINACLMLLAIFMATLIKLPPRIPRKFSMRLKNIIAKEAVIPASVTFFVAMGFNTISAFLIVYASKRGVENGIGLFFTVYALTMVVTRPAVGKLTDKYGFAKIGIPAIIMTMISLIFIGFSDRLWMFLTAAFINGFGYGAVQPTIQALCMKSVPESRRGSASATQYIFLDTATLIGPTIAGFVAEKAGYTPIMWIVMVIPLIAGMGIVFSFRRKISDIEEQFRARNTVS